MCYENLGEFWNKSKWVDPLGQAVVEHATDETSDAAESAGKRLNIPILEQEAKYNKAHTSEAVGKVGVGAASWWAGNGGLDGLLGAGAGAAGAAAPAATQTATTTAEITAQLAAEEAARLAAERAAMMGPQGFANTMEAGLMAPEQSFAANTYMPKNPMDAYQYGLGMSNAPGPGVVAPGQQFNANMDTGLMNRGMSDYAGRFGARPGGVQSKFNKFATKQGLNMLTQEEQKPQMAPPQRYQHQEQKQQPMYGQQEIPEDLKRKLRAMGYQV